ncbi:DNA polymerase-3 subunit gamma/tau [Micromonospora purpureochromogenes]|uniref:DNA polymerase III subunit gamma/tau n=1 Tax=Micromonospora purpureochromogenes TaxID=47872 RepID=A0A1C4V2U2_9ACTN|nr:DNA polymerase III subunit gamma and tau [Micromonospora purpureochromogenes]SCE78302.1 DNA polymerase-3 subunit gamma/tau [Micromonospora purpureochromogenes]
MALALYRKYRPRTFAEMIGQEHVTEPLSQALRSGRLNHAYLFSGPRGCGKTSSARILARSLNCEQGPTPEPCGTCASCRSLATDGTGSIDVIEIDAASHGGVDDARELREKAFFAPASSRFKIYIIDEAHMVSPQGFNALLKLVEEPPEYVKFIFATTEPEKVLGTIRSRTHHYPFRLFPPKVLRPYLEQLTEAEGVTVEPAVFPLVVRAGGGSMRDSLSVLDQLIAGAGPEGVSYARATALLGVTDAALIDEMCDALAAGDGAAAYATVDRVAEAGHDLRRFASDLLERLRDLIVLQQVPDAAAKGLIDGPADHVERMAAQAQRLGPGTLSRCADIVHNGLVDMRGTTAPRLLLELICARMMLPGADDTTGGLLQRLERMERRLTLGGAELPSAAAGPAPVAPASQVRPEPAPAAPSAPAPVVESRDVSVPAAAPAAEPVTPPAAPRRVPPEAVMPDPVTPAPPRPGSSSPGALDAVAVRRAWPDIVAKVNRIKKPAAALMRDAVVRDVDGDTVVLTVKSPVLAQMMGNHISVLSDALYEEFGGRWQIRCEVAGERGAATLGGPSRAAAPTRPASPPTPAPAGPATAGPTGVGPSGPSGSADGVGPSGSASGAGPSGSASGAGPSGAANGVGRSDATNAGDLGGPAGPSGGGPRGASGAAGGAGSGGPAGASGGGAAGGPAGQSIGRGSVGGPVAGGAAAMGAAGSTHGASGPTGGAGGPAGNDGVRSGGAGRPDGAGQPGGAGGPAGSDGGRPGSTGRLGAGQPGGMGQAGGTGGPAARAQAGPATHGGTGPAARGPSGPADGAGDDEDWPEPARPGSASGGDEGWPEPARPGGAATATAGGDDWPEPARPGGATATATAVPRPAGPQSAPSPAPAAATGGAPVSSAIAAARAAAAAAGTGKAARPAQAARKTADADWAGEPPYDPDFDGPLRGGGRPQPAATPAYEGFDPGDEPLDEVIDERTARQSSEEQAVQLLREAFGAEKIDEVDAR